MLDVITGDSIQALVTPETDLSKLTVAEKDALILPLVGRLEAALTRIAELERRLAKFERPAKTPANDRSEFLG